jgi:putative addiction module component (TIGR02574 family)
MERALAAKIERDMLLLSANDRLALLRKLIDSLAVTADANSDAATWLEEAQRRVGELENGTARIFPAEEVLNEYRNTLRELGD